LRSLWRRSEPRRVTATHRQTSRQGDVEGLHRSYGGGKASGPVKANSAQDSSASWWKGCGHASCHSHRKMLQTARNTITAAKRMRASAGTNPVVRKEIGPRGRHGRWLRSSLRRRTGRMRVMRWKKSMTTIRAFLSYPPPHASLSHALSFTQIRPEHVVRKHPLSVKLQGLLGKPRTA
jgi:hypothetical protein